jgi:undecaprenyl pyrophosphate phosphatase UppP
MEFVTIPVPGPTQGLTELLPVLSNAHLCAIGEPHGTGALDV